MSLLLSWICLNAFAQLPHPNDTLENGKKVPFNQFLGRFSVFNDLGGAAYYYSFNVGYSLIKLDLITTDFTLGASRIQVGQYSWREPDKDTYHVPIGLSFYLGRRASRMNIRVGYSPVLSSKLFRNEADNEDWPPPIEHKFFFSLGYTYQNPSGFFLGVNANLLVTINTPSLQEYFGKKLRYTPWPGLVLGYRLPSKRRHQEWHERGFKRRVLRVEEKTNESYDEVDKVFYNDEPFEMDTVDMLEIEQKLAKLKKRHERYLKQEQRLNGRSLVYAEFFGATRIWSLNYTYTHPIAKSNTWMMEYRGGFGTDKSNAGMPFHVGVKAMKNYRGTGVYVGVEPSVNWKTGEIGAVYFLEHNVEFHFAYGLTGGVAFYLFYDPLFFKNYWNVSPYGSFFLGYRLPQLKKS
ncbi:MAG: hypothetical protein ACPGU4_04520 [Flavobacteriales bacterium]